ncbi:hypothetical protein E2C01_083740 [Portunus trituberculatus]|uniref:Uncharacterized protein n=1 Tax=Portunus trituberculatus TaxID=210409 RepID=A0A5B7J2H3_PORTR|nr:hypothetical protein [Portunus trituberculatus]
MRHCFVVNSSQNGSQYLVPGHAGAPGQLVLLVLGRVRVREVRHEPAAQVVAPLLQEHPAPTLPRQEKLPVGGEL